jgi:hypothetical protein
MNKKIWMIIIGYVILLISCKDKTETIYYPSGNLKSVSEIRNGALHGKHETFYPSGKLQSKGDYSNGKAHGVIEHYYENGELEQKAEWEEGLLNGYNEEYFENGNLAVKAHYYQGVQVGDTYVYYKNGRLSEKQTFDTLGNLIYVYKRDQRGQKTLSYALPILKIDHDTISVKDTAIISLTFGYKITGILNLNIEEVTPDNYLIRDTLVIDDFDKKILLRKKFDGPGQYRIKIITSHYPVIGDTISVDGWFKELKILVTSEGMDERS